MTLSNTGLWQLRSASSRLSGRSLIGTTAGRRCLVLPVKQRHLCLSSRHPAGGRPLKAVLASQSFNVRGRRLIANARDLKLDCGQ